MNTRDPRARPGGTIYPKLKTITEVIVTALGFAKQLRVYKALSLSLRVTQNVTKDINSNRTDSSLHRDTSQSNLPKITGKEDKAPSIHLTVALEYSKFKQFGGLIRKGLSDGATFTL